MPQPDAIQTFHQAEVQRFKKDIDERGAIARKSTPRALVLAAFGAVALLVGLHAPGILPAAGAALCLLGIAALYRARAQPFPSYPSAARRIVAPTSLAAEIRDAWATRERIPCPIPGSRRLVFHMNDQNLVVALSHDASQVQIHAIGGILGNWILLEIFTDDDGTVTGAALPILGTVAADQLSLDDLAACEQLRDLLYAEAGLVRTGEAAFRAQTLARPTSPDTQEDLDADEQAAAFPEQQGRSNART